MGTLKSQSTSREYRIDRAKTTPGVLVNHAKQALLAALHRLSVRGIRDELSKCPLRQQIRRQ